MQPHLTMESVAQQAALAVIQGDPGFVAGGFYPEDQQDKSSG
jgi:hypothetical protein